MTAVRQLFATRGRLALTTLAVVAPLLLLRFLVQEAEWEFVVPGPLLTTVVSGGIFVVALVVAGTLSDYKECERMPAELVAGLMALLADGRAFKKEKPEFRLDLLEQRVQRIARSFRDDLLDRDSWTSLEAVDDLNESFAELDRLEVIATYISRLRAEQGAIRKIVLRANHIQHTQFVPSAYTLIWLIIAVAIGVLTFTVSETNKEGYLLLGTIYFVLIYLARLLRVLDRPFQPGQRSWDDVDLLLLDEFEASWSDRDDRTA